MKDFQSVLLIVVSLMLLYSVYTRPEPCPETNLKPNAETILILQAVESDALLQQYILSPTHRERTREAVKQFNKKYPLTK